MESEHTVIVSADKATTRLLEEVGKGEVPITEHKNKYGKTTYYRVLKMIEKLTDELNKSFDSINDGFDELNKQLSNIQIIECHKKIHNNRMKEHIKLGDSIKKISRVGDSVAITIKK